MSNEFSSFSQNLFRNKLKYAFSVQATLLKLSQSTAKGDYLALRAGVCFVICFKDLHEEPVKTIKNILIGMSAAPEVDFEILLVRDGGRRNTHVEGCRSEFSSLRKIKFVELSKSVGLSLLLDKAIESTVFSHTCLVPGNNAFTSESFTSIVQDFELFDAVLGYRENLVKARPYPKVAASRFLLFLIQLIYKPRFDFIKDFHGLNLYRTEHIAWFARFGHGHGIQISLIIPIYSLGGAISQVPVFNNLMRANRRVKYLKLPSFKQVLNVLRDLIRLKKIYP